MAKISGGPFEEDEEESVATDTTAGSSEREEYEVEKILAERERDTDGEVEWLVKWTGYHVLRASWEPRENFNNDHFITEWAKQKNLIRLGQAKPFDVEKLQADQDREAEARFLRQRRRKAKRRARGRVLSSDDDYVSDAAEDGEGTVLPVGTDRAGIEKVTGARNKRGIAQRVRQRRTDIPSSGAQNDSGSDQDISDYNSLFEEPSERATLTVTKPVLPKTSASGPAAPPAKLQSPTSNVDKAAPPLVPKDVPSTNKVVKSSKKRTSTGASIFTDWSAEKKRRGRAHVSGETPKDSTDPKFTHLAMQNRYQKYSRNEPAPNPDALTIVDPKTGKAQQPKDPPVVQPPDVRKVSEGVNNTFGNRSPLPSRDAPTTVVPRVGTTQPPTNSSVAYRPRVTREPEDIHSAYGRRSPPRRERQRSPTPPERRRTSEPALTDAPRGVQNMNGPSGTRTTAPVSADWRRIRTCWWWQLGECKYTAETCRFAHWRMAEGDEDEPQSVPPAPPHRRVSSVLPGPDVPPRPAGAFASKAETTCYFWRRGNCLKPDDQCEFAHFDTGVYAAAPGKYKTSSAQLDTDVFAQSPTTSASDTAALEGPVAISVAPMAHMQPEPSSAVRTASTQGLISEVSKVPILPSHGPTNTGIDQPEVNFDVSNLLALDKTDEQGDRGSSSSCHRKSEQSSPR